MNTFGSIIAKYRKQSKYTQSELSVLLSQYGYGITPGAISSWEKNNSQPSAVQFLALCKILSITDIYSEFIGFNPNDAMSKLNEEGIKKAFEYVNLLLLSAEYQKEDNSILHHSTRILHLYDIPVSAGFGEFLDESSFVEIEVGSEVPKIADYGVRISGDSMEPQFVNEQIVWIQKINKIEDGEIGIFYLDGKAYIKKLQDNKKGSFLISLNKNYDPIEITPEKDFRTFGRVVG